MQVTVKVNRNEFNSLSAKLKTAVMKQIANAATDAAAIARQLCPVGVDDHKDGSPHMVETIAVQVDPENGRATLTVGAPYAGFVEYGHHTVNGDFVEPQPFINPAVDAVMPYLSDKLESLI